MKIALLSNVNMNFVIRSLKSSVDIYEAEGYGNELGILMNPQSSYHAFAPEVTFMVMDLMELLGHDLQMDTGAEKIQDWFAMFSATIKEGTIYYVSDVKLMGPETVIVEDPVVLKKLEALWLDTLDEVRKEHKNVRIFPYSQLLSSLGEDNAYSMKTWYLGKILHSGAMQQRLSALILEKVALESRTPKKVLVLDLDNTLWGGICGEAENTPLKLSEDHGGLAYKNLQRCISLMQKRGVILAIASKNNEADALEVIENHPHMVLRKSDFASMRINWNPKNISIQEIAEELNLGLSSFVFFDDNPAERQLIQETLPEITVPEFPASAQDLPETMAEIYKKYFQKPVLTGEDLEKTKQYQENAKRNALKSSAGSFEEYLKSLEMVVEKVSPKENSQRLLDLLNKTNQFNLTTVRHTFEELEEMISSDAKQIYLYRVSDKFGDNGIVACAIVDLVKPCICEFVMSCRVMGRWIEQAILQDIEQDMIRAGKTHLEALYVPSAKNQPVAKLYTELGYIETREGVYDLDLQQIPERHIFVTMK